MYSHLFKGSTLGYLLTRRALRDIFCIPGIVLDAFTAVFWGKDYLRYWDQCRIEYIDGTSVAFWQGIFGYVPDLIGTGVGWLAGGIIGAACYFAEAPLRVTYWLHNKLGEKLDNFANSFPYQWMWYQDHPSNYLEKASNIAMGTLGEAVGFICFAPIRFCELLFAPSVHFFSDVARAIGRIVGGYAALIPAIIPGYFIHKLLENSEKMFNSFRNGVRNISAYIYAKTNAPIIQNVNTKQWCYPIDNIHSAEFLNVVDEYKRKNTSTALLYNHNIQGEHVDSKNEPPTVARPQIYLPEKMVGASAPIAFVDKPSNGAYPSI